MKYEKAMAFVESLIGWEDIAETTSKSKSPHARTHLESALGMGFGTNIHSYTNIPTGDIKALEELANYLTDVGITIISAIAIEKEKNKNRG